jgi:hypothetical protein
MSQVWKVSPLGRVAVPVFVAVIVAIDFVSGNPVEGVAALVVGAAIAWLFAFWPALILTETEVIARNPWGTRRVPLEDVAGIGGAYAGLSIKRHSGGSVTAWAVQKSNAAKWSGKATRADEVAAAITAAAGRARAGK